MYVTTDVAPATYRLDACGFDRQTAEARHDASRDPCAYLLLRAHNRQSILEVALDRIEPRMELDHRVGSALDLEHCGVDLEPPDRLQQSRIVAQHDDLPRFRHLLEDA